MFLIPEVSIRAESAPSQSVTFEQSGYTVCEVDLRRQSVKLFWTKPDGHAYEFPCCHGCLVSTRELSAWYMPPFVAKRRRMRDPELPHETKRRVLCDRRGPVCTSRKVVSWCVPTRLAS